MFCYAKAIVTGLYEPAKFPTKMRSLTDVKDLYKESYLVVPNIKFIFGARGWTRTSTSVKTLAPEASASTNSATRA